MAILNAKVQKVKTITTGNGWSIIDLGSRVVATKPNPNNPSVPLNIELDKGFAVQIAKVVMETDPKFMFVCASHGSFVADASQRQRHNCPGCPPPPQLTAVTHIASDDVDA